MNLTLRIVTLVGVVALVASATGGVAVAEEISTDIGMEITILCGDANGTTAVPNQVTLQTTTDPVEFEALDTSVADQLALRSTPTKAFRLVMDINSCFTDGWSVTASITDFAGATSATNTIPGSLFRLPIGDPLSTTMGATVTGNTPVPGLTAPSVSFVTFSEATPGLNSGSVAIATAAAGTTGALYMDYTGQLANIPASTATDVYSATFTVTFQPATGV